MKPYSKVGQPGDLERVVLGSGGGVEGSPQSRVDMSRKGSTRTSKIHQETDTCVIQETGGPEDKGTLLSTRSSPIGRHDGERKTRETLTSPVHHDQ